MWTITEFLPLYYFTLVLKATTKCNNAVTHAASKEVNAILTPYYFVLRLIKCYADAPAWAIFVKKIA